MSKAKKILSVILVSVIIIGCTLSFSNAETVNPDIVVTNTLTLGTVGDDGTFTLSVTIPANSDIGAITCDIFFNNALVSYVNCVQCDLSGMYDVSNLFPGRVRISWAIAGDAGLTDETSVVLKFKTISESYGQCKFIYYNSVTALADADNTIITSKADPAYLNIGLTELSLGNNAYCFKNDVPSVIIGKFSDGHSEEVKGCNFPVLDSSTNGAKRALVSASDEKGNSVSNLVFVTVVTRGDLSGNGSAGLEDYSLIKNALDSGTNFEQGSVDLFKYDVTGDGAVDAFDWFYIDKIINGFAS